MKFAFSNFGKKSKWMVDDGLLDIEVQEEEAASMSVEAAFKLGAGWAYADEEPTLPEGWFAFELANMPGAYYLANKANVRDIIATFAYEQSEGYAPYWIARPTEATNKVIRRIRNILYW